MEKGKDVQAAAGNIEETDIKFRWLEGTPQADYWRGVLLAIRKRRNEIVELVIAERGDNTHVVECDRRIAEHLSELEACGIDPFQSEYLDELKSWRIVAGKAAVMGVIDDPLVRRTLDWKSEKTKEIRKTCEEESAAAKKTESEGPPQD